MIQSMSNFSFYVEKYKDIKIPVNTSVNSSGVLNLDEKGNSLNTSITSGTRKLNILTNYNKNYLNSLLLYSSNSYYLINDSNELDCILNYKTPLSYFINAKADVVTFGWGRTIDSINFTGRKIFKVFINNLEITDYTVSNTSITLGTTVFLNPYENILKVIHYAVNQTITNEFYFIYKSVDLLYDVNSATCDNLFFKDMLKFNNIDPFSTSTSLENTKISNETESLEYVNGLNNNYITVQMFGSGENLRSYVGTEFFRVVCYDRINDVLTYYNNCKINNAEQYNYDKSYNKRTTQIDYEDEIVIFGTHNRSIKDYGTGLYGTDTYGGVVVYNSSNRRS